MTLAAESLAEAQATAGRTALAARDALGQSVVVRSDLTPADTDATQAFAADDLGQGITSEVREGELP